MGRGFSLCYESRGRITHERTHAADVHTHARAARRCDVRYEHTRCVRTQEHTRVDPVRCARTVELVTGKCTHEIALKQLKSDCIYRSVIGLEPNGIPFGSKSMGNGK